MTLDEFLIITCLVLAVVAYGGYQYFSWNVYLHYSKDRKEKEMQFENNMPPVQIVAVQFRSRYQKDTFMGREYTYIADVPLAVGDLVKVPTKFGESEARVSRVNVPIAEIQCRVGQLRHITEAPTIGGLFAGAV